MRIKFCLNQYNINYLRTSQIQMIEKKNNKKYWNKFYKKKLTLNKPSGFAFFTYKFLKKNYTKIVDVGCGNGRDLFYFQKKKIECFGIDLSRSATTIIKSKMKKKNIINKIFNDDFIKFNYKKKINGIFSIYSRFTWHSINKKDENIFIKKISKLSNLKFVFIETRSNKDELCGIGKKISQNEYITDHYRRFIDKNDLIRKLKKSFKIIYIKESKGFSKFNNEDPCLIRLIAQKK